MDKSAVNTALQNAVAFLKGQKIIKKDSEISLQTGYSPGSVSTYISGNTMPSKNFIAKFQEVFKLDLKDFVNNSQKSTAVELPINIDIGDEDKKLTSIYNLAEGNKVIAEAQKVLANSNAELVQLIKKFSSADHANNQKAAEPISDAVLEVLAEAALQKFRSKEEAFAFLHSKLKGGKQRTAGHN